MTKYARSILCLTLIPLLVWQPTMAGARAGENSFNPRVNHSRAVHFTSQAITASLRSFQHPEQGYSAKPILSLLLFAGTAFARPAPIHIGYLTITRPQGMHWWLFPILASRAITIHQLNNKIRSAKGNPDLLSITDMDAYDDLFNFENRRMGLYSWISGKATITRGGQQRWTHPIAPLTSRQQPRNPRTGRFEFKPMASPAEAFSLIATNESLFSAASSPRKLTVSHYHAQANEVRRRQAAGKIDIETDRRDLNALVERGFLEKRPVAGNRVVYGYTDLGMKETLAVQGRTRGQLQALVWHLPPGFGSTPMATDVAKTAQFRARLIANGQIHESNAEKYVIAQMEIENGGYVLLKREFNPDPPTEADFVRDQIQAEQVASNLLDLIQYPHLEASIVHGDDGTPWIAYPYLENGIAWHQETIRMIDIQLANPDDLYARWIVNLWLNTGENPQKALALERPNGWVYCPIDLKPTLELESFSPPLPPGTSASSPVDWISAWQVELENRMYSRIAGAWGRVFDTPEAFEASENWISRIKKISDEQIEARIPLDLSGDDTGAIRLHVIEGLKWRRDHLESIAQQVRQGYPDIAKRRQYADYDRDVESFGGSFSKLAHDFEHHIGVLRMWTGIVNRNPLLQEAVAELVENMDSFTNAGKRVRDTVKRNVPRTINDPQWGLHALEGYLDDWVMEAFRLADNLEKLAGAIVTTGMKDSSHYQTIFSNEGRVLSRQVMRFVTDKGRFDPIGEPQNINVTSVIQNVIRDIQPQLNRPILFELNTDMPLVRIDPDKLYDALFNLILNAHEQLGTVTVHITAAVLGDSVTIDVIDDGPGFAAGMKDHVFQIPVSSKGETSNGDHGNGLMNIAQIIREADGSIALLGSDIGAHIFIRLPIIPAPTLHQPGANGRLLARHA